MRINKFISETGVCSRREADKLVESGRVTINGERAVLGSQAEAGDDVRIDGKRLVSESQTVYIVLNKPVGITSTTESHVKGNIVDFVGHHERIFPIGRLDKDSEGLILLTNDGDIVNKILRAEGRHEKEYVVTVDRPITPSFIAGMSSGVKILGAKTLPCQVTRITERVFRIVLTEGKNRQIRRMCSAFGYEVRRLQRIRIMNIRLGNLQVGAWRDLTTAEKAELGDMLSYKLL
ncbi:23S rRNA pseudouridine(2604) synthase RluF [Paenibacillus zanthoxyli]|uniref:23S rRNA pseudouridine(2604) synthase RluF n=1 Tax=Paenibacillus zanthoxyli TaxID=369399 RepID=UPI00046FC064|nr:23S rRNA pseudouridine(2604) synthase RluF [Paenibacillus zanthoxyli]